MKNQVEQNIDQQNSILRVKIQNSLVLKVGLVCLNSFRNTILFIFIILTILILKIDTTNISIS